MKKIKTLKELNSFIDNVLLLNIGAKENSYAHKELEHFIKNNVEFKYVEYLQNSAFSKAYQNIRFIRYENDSVTISSKEEGYVSDRDVVIEELVNTAYGDNSSFDPDLNNVIIPKVFEEGVIFFNFRSHISTDLQKYIAESIKTGKDITLENVSLNLNMNHVETYIFSKKHGFRIYKDGELLRTVKSEHLKRADFFTLEHNNYSASYFPKVAEYKKLLLDILQRGTVINGQKDKELFKDLIINEVIEAKWDTIFNTIDQQYNYYNSSKKDQKITASNVFDHDCEPTLDEFGYIIFSYTNKSIEYKCDCQTINLIENLDCIAESFYDQEKFVELCKLLNENVCVNCGSSIDTSEMTLNENRGYNKSLYSHSLYLITHKNKPITLPVPTNAPVLGYKYEIVNENDLMMRFYSFRLNHCGVATVSPALVSYMKSGKNNKFEYYCSKSRLEYPDFVSSFSSENYGGLTIKETPSSVSKINTEVFPLNPEENIEIFNQLGFNQYNVHDLYCKTNNINTLRDKYRSMILWEGEFPVVYKTMPMLETLIKTKDYYQVGIDIINNSISSNIIKRHLDVKETKPKNILRLSNDKLNIYNNFIKKYYLPSIDYSMIATLEELEALVEKCDYNIFEAYYIASQNASSDTLIPITRRSINKIKDLNLEIKNVGNKVVKYLINTSKKEYPQGILMLPTVADIYSDYINMLIEINNEDTITENVLFPEHLEREHDRISEELVSSLSKLNREKFNKVALEVKDELDIDIEDNNYTVVVPEKSKDLIFEGNTLNHCVGSYVNSVANKKSTIVFVRQKTNKNDPLYTLELHNVHKKESLINKGQFYGLYNRIPEKQAQDFVNKYVQKLNELRMKKKKTL